MAIKFSELAKGSRTVIVRWEGEECKVQYRPGANTAAFAIGLQEAMEESASGGTKAIVESLANMLIGWDVLDDKGEPMPIEADDLMGYPVGFLSAILNAIAEDQAPNARKSGR